MNSKPTYTSVTKRKLDQLAISEGEYEEILNRLGRAPNDLELGLFGSLWSEHCGYKHSKPLLSLFTGKNSRVLVDLGAENAGAIDIGDGIALVFKIESHNHPSAIEPYEGAATGIGGIVRDIFAMGSRPVALMNSLRFGPLDDSRNRYIFEGVVSGISGYGNCIGVPNVGGETFFSGSYSGNPLVNAMCVGIARIDQMVHATTGGPGNVLLLVGAHTGRDGIHGASGLASRTFEETEETLRPTVQVGNPFLEKKLIEACLEVSKLDVVVGVQDLGAAGLTSSVVEAASNGGSGVEIDVSLVSRRDADMDPYEIMLSESQERMLIVVRDGQESLVQKIFDKWDLESSVIGKVTDDGLVRILQKDVVVGELPVHILTDPPLYRPQGSKPAWLQDLQDYDMEDLQLPSASAYDILISLLSSPNIASKEWIYRQYDHHVQTNTMVGPGGDAAVLRIKGSGKAFALSTDGNGRYCYLDPYVGGVIAVAEACRNISCTGAFPAALTDCLNFGNPEKPDIYYQMKECVAGMAKASQVMEVPIVSGNVSLYNETQDTSIYPTPIIGAVGLFDDSSSHVGIGFKGHGDAVVLIGQAAVHGSGSDLAGSEYLDVVHSLVVGRPRIDIDLEIRVQKICRELIRAGIVKSAHDCSDGGLAIALAECCIASGIGFMSEFQLTGRWDSALYGERQSRIILSLERSGLNELKEVCLKEDVPWVYLGTASGTNFKLNNLIDISLKEIDHIWANALERLISGHNS